MLYSYALGTISAIHYTIQWQSKEDVYMEIL